MRSLRPAAARYHAQFLQHLTEQARHDANAWLQAQAAARTAAAHSAVRADFLYVDPLRDATTPQRIPADQFERQFALCLDGLELTVYGYYAKHQFGWERCTEAVLCAGHRAWWRRVLRPAPLLALRINAGAGATGVSVEMAAPLRAACGAPYIVRLDADTQAALARLHGAPSRSCLRRLLACFGWGRGAATPSETDT